MSRQVTALPIELPQKLADVQSWCDKMNVPGILSPTWHSAGDWLMVKMFGDSDGCDPVCASRHWVKRYGPVNQPGAKEGVEWVFCLTERPGCRGKWDVKLVGTIA